jgi:dTDP-4-dehydrorhamnose 3,5-epimerase-like enzyme
MSKDAFVAEEILSGCRLVDLAVKGDERGSLIAIEGGKECPFDIARVYYLFETQAGVARGFHAHRDLTQWAVCVAGSCTVVLDDGRKRAEVRLCSPVEALEIGSGIWRELKDFSPDAVVLVLASKIYDERDYIRDYNEFLKTVGAV